VTQPRVGDQDRARIGVTLKNQWRIDALIGTGGMAAVYSATALTGERAAVKMLHPVLSLDEGVRTRFAREGYVANTINHRGVARVLDDGVAPDGSAFLVMELLEGETAAARAARLGGKLPVNEVAGIGEAVADILAAAHAVGVIHRDIKPDNVFITNKGRIVVLDFGIARVASAALGGMSESATRTGTMMGTPAFMPPEQARGRANEMDATSDVWALGSTLFWLASGRVVHQAETPNEQLVAAATLPAVSLAHVAPHVPPSLIAAIDRALQLAKENRFKDALGMKQALHVALVQMSPGGEGTSSNDPADPLTAPTLSPISRAMLLRAAIIGALLAAAILAVVALIVRHR
jgi:serine/threonine protein kinase